MTICQISKNYALVFLLTSCVSIASLGEETQDYKPLRKISSSDLHILLDELLQKHVDEAGLVNYGALALAQDHLDEYLNRIAKTDPVNLIYNGKLAYWINAYNAFTIRLILDHYPIKSIKNIPRRWVVRKWIAGEKNYSLNEIEHKILRKELKEPRIHFAIVCASIGCPRLWNHAFTENNIDEQLDRITRIFFLSEEHFRHEIKKDVFGKYISVLYLSKILKWFEDDFTNGGKNSIEDFLVNYVDFSLTENYFKTSKKIKVKYLPYNWNLNEQ